MIVKIFVALFLLQVSLFSEVFEVSEFESDIFSKQGNKLQKVTLSLWMEGRELNKSSYQITDALNIIISSFYLEDLLTSKGKEQFKTSLTQYLAKKYHVTLEALYINKLTRNDTVFDMDELISRMKKEGCCKKDDVVKKVFDTLAQ